jgi:hypothetical protein
MLIQVYTFSEYLKQVQVSIMVVEKNALAVVKAFEICFTFAYIIYWFRYCFIKLFHFIIKKKLSLSIYLFPTIIIIIVYYQKNKISNVIKLE